jgi:6-pyruvoyl-tetrahydropterin synthase
MEQVQLQRLMAVMEGLRAQASVRVGDIIVSPLYSQWNHQGIYEIREPDDKQTVYIGKTKKAREGVAQRIWDHANQVSDLVNTLEVSRQTFADYRVRSIKIEDARFRGLAEYFGIAICDPKGNRVE